MATTITPMGLTDALRAVADADADATAENIGASKIYSIDLDNAANAAVTYLKFWNQGGPTVGTTVPHMIIHIAASVRRIWHFIGGNDSFSAGMSMAAVTAAGTAGSTGPTSDVVVDLFVE